MEDHTYDSYQPIVATKKPAMKPERSEAKDFPIEKPYSFFARG